MRKRIICYLLLFSLFTVKTFAFSQDSIPAMKGKELSCQVKTKEAFEVESLFPMFLTGGFHVAVGYRYKNFRVRFSVINGGHYDAEKAGVDNFSYEFKRYYKTSPGLFLGYNVWRNLELYTYFELHTFQIEQKSTGDKKNLFSFDTGVGLGYQFFIGKAFYLQPAFHVYLRDRKSIYFGNDKYTIPGMDLSPVIRIGYRLWRR